MVITYYGAGCVKAAFGDIVIGVNPIGKASGEKTSRFGADVALVAASSPLCNGVENLTSGSKEPFVVEGPGEYEYSDIFIKGYASEGPDGLVNTIYSFILEGMRIVHLGLLADGNLSPDILEEISGADILIVPAGEAGTLQAKVSAKLAASLESKIIIPVFYEGKKSKLLADFLQEAGKTDAAAESKLSIKKKDLEGKEAEVVVLDTE